jgi:DNA-binding SARP family transcriptional activator/Tfp pilus assembly protein PilF
LSVKLVPPAIGPAHMARPRLEALLDEVVTKRLTVLVAGAGFGKSTLLASWAARGNCAWYSLGPEDSHVPTLARGIVDAVRLRVPVIPLDISAALVGGGSRSGHSEDTELSRAQALAEFLARALEDNLGRELCCLLDDLDEVGLSSAAGELIASLCRQAPANFHLVISSRTEPPFAIDRLRGRGQVLELTGTELSFDESEVAALVAKHVGEPARPISNYLHALTDGWPAAVRLGVEALRNVAPEDRFGALERLRRPGGSLYGYLAAEVLGAEPEQVRRLISIVARTGFAAPGLCEELGVTGAADVLRSLARRGVFVEGRGQRLGWFSLSTLVKETAAAELPLVGDDARAVDEKTAVWLEQEGHVAEALRHSRACADWEMAAQLLVRHGSQLVRTGEVSEVLSTVEALPPEMRGPDIEFIAGEGYFVVGDWDGALAAYGAAGGAGALPVALAWRVARIHHFRGDLDQALEVYGGAEMVDGNDRDTAMLLAWRASARWLRGDAAGCRLDATRARQIARALGAAEALSCAYTALAMLAALEGDRVANDAFYLRALDYAIESGDVLQQVRVRTNRGSLHLEQGYYEEAIAELDLALRLAELAGFASYRALALSNRGCAYYFLGRLEEAVADLDEARRQAERLGSADVAYALTHLGRIYSDRGDLVLARAAYEEAVDRCQQAQDLQGLVPALAGLAVVLAADEPVKAEELARRAVGFGPGMGYVEALVASGWVALAAGRLTDAAQHAEEAAGQARLRRDRAALAQSLELTALCSPTSATALDSLGEAIGLWSELGSQAGTARAELLTGLVSKDSHRAEAAAIRLASLGVRSQRPLQRLLAKVGLLAEAGGRPEHSVSVQALGRFRVLVDGAPVPPSGWQSKKARDLLKILVARRGRPVPREALMELLWPDEPLDKVANRLSVALSTLRAVLDPGKQAPSSRYIVSTRDSCQLGVDHVEVDVEKFLARAAAGLDRARAQEPGAMDLLGQAESCYTGEFLEENAYDDWAIGLREEARGTYLLVCRALAADCEVQGDFAAAARYLRRLLERDPYDEAAHLGLVRVLVSGAQHGEAHRCYRAYSSRMSEIGVEPAPFTPP